MSDFLLELLSEEIPARMQEKARADLARLFADQLAAAEMEASETVTYATPRRLALIARGLPDVTASVIEDVKGPPADAPDAAIEGFLRKFGLTRDALQTRVVKGRPTLFAVTSRQGRPTASVLAEAIPDIVRAFPWPKSMRWGAASISTESPRWVRPLQGIVALLDSEIVDFEIAGIRSGAATIGHRFHHPGVITIGSAGDYAEKLRACHVVVDQEERKALIRDGAARAAAEVGLALVEDEGLVAENAGLTEWPVALLGGFDPAFLDLPREVIQLTMRTNQKYFALHPPRDGEGDRPKPLAKAGGGGAVPGAEPPPSALQADTSPSRGGLAPNFLCVANIDATDGGAAIIAGNGRVLSARLADAKFFWEQDLKIPLAEQAKKLDQIVFHEKLGTVADKVERVAKLARWLVEEGIVKSSPGRGGGPPAQPGVEGAQNLAQPPLHQPAAGPPPRPGEDREHLAALAESAARLAKADLVTGLVGEFPELQGVIGGHLACAQGLDPQIADAIRDHYKPVGQGDEVPTAPVTVAVSLADKLDTLVGFYANRLKPTGSRDPFALRRAAIGVIATVMASNIRASLARLFSLSFDAFDHQFSSQFAPYSYFFDGERRRSRQRDGDARHVDSFFLPVWPDDPSHAAVAAGGDADDYAVRVLYSGIEVEEELLDFFADRLKVQQREAGVRHDLIDAVFALGGEDDLVRLLARVKALQAFVETPEGADLLAGYKRAANILRKEGWPTPLPGREGAGVGAAEGGPAATEGSLRSPPTPSPSLAGRGEQGRNKKLSYTPETEETALIAALDSAEPRARAAVEAEDFEGAMAALASLRAPVDAFFDKVIVNDPDPDKRAARLDLLMRMRDAVHRVADFSRIEG